MPEISELDCWSGPHKLQSIQRHTNANCKAKEPSEKTCNINQSHQPSKSSSGVQFHVPMSGPQNNRSYLKDLHTDVEKCSMLLCMHDWVKQFAVPGIKPDVNKLLTLKTHVHFLLHTAELFTNNRRYKGQDTLQHKLHVSRQTLWSYWQERIML